MTGSIATSAWNLPVAAPVGPYLGGRAAASARRSWDCWRKLNERRALSIHIDTARGRSDAQRSRHSSEVTTRELAAGTGFQIALERDGATFVSKLDEDVKFPRPTVSCMLALTSVVGGQSRTHI